MLLLIVASYRLDPEAQTPEFRSGLKLWERYADGLASADVVTRVSQQFASRTGLGRALMMVADWTQLPGTLRTRTSWTAMYAAASDAHFEVSRRVNPPLIWSQVTAADVMSSEFEQRLEQHVAANNSLNAILCRHIRDLFGPLPFRTVPFDPAWRMPTALTLAQAIYDEEAWDRLPMLGDALEEAGCSDTDILNHCRQPGVHAKGCWVVDLVLE